MKLSRDTWLGLGIVALLLVTSIVVGLQQGRTEIPYLSTSSGRLGTRALRMWLDTLGYQMAESTAGYYEVPARTDIVMILQPLALVNEKDAEVLDEWVDKGGTLILAGDRIPARLAFQAYDFSTDLLNKTAPALPAGTPLLLSPPQTKAAPAKADYYFITERTDYVSLLAWEGKPVVVSFEKGKGRVILSTVIYPFSNAGMKEEGNDALVLNLVSAAVKRKTVWFDEWHHGIQNANIIGPSQWLRRTSTGHAILFVASAIFLVLVFQGQGFGRPVPLPHEIRRRGPLEHVTAVANLNRKAGHRSAVLQQYHQQLKRHLGRRYRLDPSLPDEEYVQQLAGYNPALNSKELADLLSRLSQKNPSEAEMVNLAERASRWMMNQ